MLLIGSGSILFPVSLVLINARTRTHGGTVALSGFAQGVAYALGALGPLLVGLLHDASGGWTLPLLFLLAVALVADRPGDHAGAGPRSSRTSSPADRTRRGRFGRPPDRTAPDPARPVSPAPVPAHEVRRARRTAARLGWAADNDRVTTETATAPTPPVDDLDATAPTQPAAAEPAAPVPAGEEVDAPGVAVPPLRVVVVSGMSGAGRSTAADNLEDLGWYVVDNLPPSVLPEVCDEARRTGIRQLAVVLDVRTRSFFEQLPTMFAELKATGTVPEIVYLEASDEVIVRRQESVRRPHPLQGNGRLLDGIHRERDLLATLRAAADLVIDTSSLNVHQLGSRISHAYGGPTTRCG